MQLLLDSRTDDVTINDKNDIDLTNIQYEKKLTNLVNLIASYISQPKTKFVLDLECSLSTPETNLIFMNAYFREKGANTLGYLKLEI